ncbi:uncharacterized protein DEA37_0008810 [Paragonimus westermani]|uniref:Uncharacterized protein n=1 Tax=Paragonimus westermani TaxID=34504 RepID=A0A5J4P495_9TREM|nr:uncharacterized protein DEA37_0008810 [Paragonimus westermani]
MLGNNENFGTTKKKVEKDPNEGRDDALSPQPKEGKHENKSKLKKKKAKTRSTDSGFNMEDESETLKPKDVRKLNITEIKLPGRAGEKKLVKKTMLNVGQEAENGKAVTRIKPLNEKHPLAESQRDYTLNGEKVMEIASVKKRKKSKVFTEAGTTPEIVDARQSAEAVDKAQNTRLEEADGKSPLQHQFPDSLHSAKDRNELRLNVKEDHNEEGQQRSRKSDKTKLRERESVQKYTKEDDIVGYEIPISGTARTETTESDRSGSESLPKHRNRKEPHGSLRGDLVGKTKGYRFCKRKHSVRDDSEQEKDESTDNHSEQYPKSYDHPKSRDRQRRRHWRRNSNGSEDGRFSGVYNTVITGDHRKGHKAHSLPPRIHKRTGSEDRDKCSCMSGRKRVADNYETKRLRCVCDCDSPRPISQCRDSRCGRPEDELIEVLSEMCSDMENRLLDETFHSVREIRQHHGVQGTCLGRYLSPDTLMLLDAIEHPISTSSMHGRKMGCKYSQGLPPQAPRRQVTETDMERPSCQCSSTVGLQSQKMNTTSASVINTCPIYYAVPQPVPVTAMATSPTQPTATWYQPPLPVSTPANVLLRSNPASLIAPHQVSPTPTIYSPLMVPNITVPAVQTSMLFPSFAYCQRI